MSSYRRVLRSLGPLARRPGRSAWNPQPAPPGPTLRPRAHKFVLSAARHAFETTDDPTTTTTTATNAAVNFLNSCKGTTDTALCNRIAILNTSTLARQHPLKKSWNTTSSQKDIVQHSVTTNVQHFLSTQVTSLNQHLGKYFVARTSHSAAAQVRAFTTTTTATATSSEKKPNANLDTTTTTTTTTEKPYVQFGQHDGPEEEDDEFEMVNEIWEVRQYTHTGREYIYNRTTNEIRPAEEAFDSNSDTLLQSYNPPSITVKSVREDIGEEIRELRWEEHAEIRGDRLPYYLNRATGECTWKFPFEDPTLVPEFPTSTPHQFMRVSNVNEVPYAPLKKRFSAAAIDFVIMMSGTSVYSSIMYYEMGPKCLPGIAILAFVAYSWRDAVLDEGSRGLGKRYMGLEIVKEKDGTLPGRYETVGRSFYFISYYGLLALGVFEMPDLLYAALGLFVTDVGLMVTQGKRIGDYLFRTKVIEIQEMREERVKDRTKYLKAESMAA